MGIKQIICSDFTMPIVREIVPQRRQGRFNRKPYVFREGKNTLDQTPNVEKVLHHKKTERFQKLFADSSYSYAKTAFDQKWLNHRAMFGTLVVGGGGLYCLGGFIFGWFKKAPLADWSLLNVTLFKL